jgi:hypothetical protein
MNKPEMEFFKNALFKAARFGDRIILVSHVPKRQTGITCLECGDCLTVKKGEKNIHHFSHKKGSKCGSVNGNIGSGESKAHNDAKYRIADRFENSTGMTITRRTCYRCYKTEIMHDLTTYKTNGYFACIEYPYLDLKKVSRKADVAIIDNSGNIHMVIEILHRHATPEANREGCNWIELNADSVVNNKDDHFVCVRESPNICPECELEIKEEQKRLEKIRWDRERELERKRIIEERRRQQEEVERLEQEKQANIIMLYQEKRSRIMAMKYLQACVRRVCNQPEYKTVIMEIRKQIALRIRHSSEIIKNKAVFNKVMKELRDISARKQIDIEKKHSLEIIKNKKLFDDIINSIRDVVKWIEPIKPPVKHMKLASNTTCENRYCLICRKFNSDKIINKCKCDRPKYKPINGVLLFV